MSDPEVMHDKSLFPREAEWHTSEQWVRGVAVGVQDEETEEEAEAQRRQKEKFKKQKMKKKKKGVK